MEDKTVATQLKDLIVEHFNLGELQELCFEIGFDYEELPNTKGEKSINVIVLLKTLHQKDLLSQFVNLCKEKRRFIEWPNAPTELYFEEDLQTEAELQEALDEYKKYIRAKWGRDSLLDGPLDDFYIWLEGQEPEEKNLKEASSPPETSKASLPESSSDDSEASKQNQDKKEPQYVSYRPPPLVLEEALEKHERLIVLGTAGTGKSTFLRRLVYQKTTNNGSTIPIWVKLSDYAEVIGAYAEAIKKGNPPLVPEPSLEQWAIKEAHKDLTIQAILNKAIEDNQVLWLLDGFDETGNQMNKVADAIAGLHSKNKLVLTTRPDARLKEHQHRFNATQYEMRDLNSNDIKSFLGKWFKDQNKTSEVLEWLAADHHRQRLTAKPLYLVLLATITKETSRKDWPETRVQLYGRFIDIFLRKQIDRQNREEGVDEFHFGKELIGTKARDAALQGFHYLGWVLFHQEIESVDNRQTIKDNRPEVKEQVVTCLHEGKGYSLENATAIFSFWQRTGVQESSRRETDVQKQETGVQKPFHQTFWPYAAACKLYDDWQTDAESTWQFLSSATRELPYASRLHHPAWQEPILMLAALMNEKQLNILIDHLLSKQDKEERYLHQNLRLATAILGEIGVGNLDKNYEQKIIKQLGKLALESASPYIFLTALSSTGEAGILELEKAFELFQRSEDELSFQVIKALGETRSEKAVPFLSNIMDERWRKGNIKLAAADALGKIDHESATEALIRGIEKDAYIALHGEINWYKANSPFRVSATAVSPLIDALKNSRESGVRRLAAITLGEIGNKRAIPPLISALNENSDFVSEPAANALVKIGIDSIPDLYAALNKESVSNPTRYRIALILVDLGRFRAIHHLMPYLKNSDGDVVRNTIRKVLVQVGKVKGEKAAHLYLQTCKLNPRDETTRTVFLGVLEELDLPRIVLDLTNLSHSPLQYFLLEALGELGVPLVDIEHDLIRAAINSSWKGTWQDIQIIKILGEIGSVAAIPHLLDILNKNQHILAEIAQTPTDYEYIRALIPGFNNCYVEKAAVEALGKIKANAAVPALTHILTFDDKKIVAAIATAFKQEDIRETITTSIYFGNLPDLRATAAIALREIGDTAPLDSIFHVLARNDNTGRIAAVYALGSIRNGKAVPHLIEILTTANSNFPWEEADVYKATATALGQIGDARAVPPLIDLIENSYDYGMQDAAMKALKQIEIDVTDEETISNLIEALGDWREQIHQTANEILMGMGGSVVMLLCDASRNSNDQQIRYRIMQILGELGDGNAIPLLVETLESSDKSVSHAAIQALAKIGSIKQDGFEKLVEVFNNKQKSYLHVETAVALGQLAPSISDENTLESARKALWQRRFSNYKENVFTAYEKVVTSLTIVQVRELPQNDKHPSSASTTKTSIFSHIRDQKWLLLFLTAVLLVAIETLSGFFAEILGSYLPAGIAGGIFLVVLVLIIILLIGIERYFNDSR